MSDPASPLGHSSFHGFATIREIGPVGMVTLRAKGLAALEKAIRDTVGTAVPQVRRIERNGAHACGWMSPDEYLLLMPYQDVQKSLATLAETLGDQHHLAVDVSDARAVFRVEGDRATDVLRKLCPVDFDRLAPGELRRTRAAQVAVALWHEDGGFTLVCFRSVAAYVMGLLQHSAQQGSEL